MKFFKRKKNESHSRRNSRLWLGQARRAVLGGLAAGGLFSAGFAIIHNNALDTLNGWANGQALARTAAAGFTVQDILVTGRRNTPADEVLKSLNVARGEPLFGVSIAAAERALTAVPWIKNVRISRQLPDTIAVALEERQPVALWQYQKKLSLIDDTGAVLATENLDAWKGLPLVVGDGAEKSAAALIALIAAEPAVASQLAAAVRIEDRRWDLRLKNGMTVKLPENETELALRHLGLLETQKQLFARDIAAIDLRQPERMIVTPAHDLTKTTTKTTIQNG